MHTEGVTGPRTAAESGARMRPAIFAKTFARASVSECLQAVHDAGLTAAQFNLAVAGLPTIPVEEVPDAVVAQIRAAAEESGVTLSAISGTFNAAHPDPAVRADFVRRFPLLCRAAQRLGVPIITLSSGSRDADDLWRWHPDNSTPTAWQDSRDTLGRIAAIAADHGLIAAVEPEHSNVVSTAALGVRMREQVGSPALEFVYDAANLLDTALFGADVYDDAAFDGAAFDDAAARRQISSDIAALAPNIALAHAKELAAGREQAPAGRGWLPWRHIVEELHVHGYQGAFVIHGLAEADVPVAVATLDAALAASTASPVANSGAGDR
jgi:sugar phosphate isomerase/epimerase